MSGVEVSGEIVTFIVTILGALGPTIPWITRLRSKIATIRTLLEQIDLALADGKLTPAEMRAIVTTARKVTA